MNQGNDIFINTYPSAAFVNIKIHPLVVFNILDHFLRRPFGSTRVIGTLLGVYHHDGTVEVRNSFAVPHSTDPEITIEKDIHHDMFELHQKIYPKELVIGWYSTGNIIDEASQALNSLYENEFIHQTPIHLMVDTNLTDLQLSVKAFTSTNVTMNNKWLGTQFLPIATEIKTLDVEKIGLKLLSNARDSENGKTPLLSDLQQLTNSVGKLNELVDIILDYVKKVVDGKVNGDPKIGRFLSDALSALPKLDSGLEKSFNNSVQDLLMVVYLANLTKTQLILAEKAQRVA